MGLGLMDPPVTLTAHMENCDGWELLSTVSRKDNGSPHPHHRKNEPSSSFPIVLEVKTMASLGFCKSHCRSPFLSDIPGLRKLTKARGGSSHHSNLIMPRRMYRLVVRGCSGENQPEEKKKAERQTFLTLEEAGLVEVSGLSTHERFLCRLTISSLNLMRVISDQEGCPIEELNAGRICDWFVKDKLKREQDIDSAVLQWDDSEFQF